MQENKEYKDLEKILDKNAKKYMLSWNIEKFKTDYRRLFKTIIESMKEVSDIKK